jgi:hypothetical protein
MEFLRPTKPKLVLALFLIMFVFFFLPPFLGIEGEPTQCYGKGRPIEGYCIMFVEFSSNPLMIIGLLVGIFVSYILSCGTVFLLQKYR